MITELITKLQNKTNLTYDEVSQVMTDILNGKTNDQENLDFLKHLTEKVETDETVLLQLDSLYAEQP